MAKQSTPNKGKQKGQTSKSGKPGIGTRFRNFFGGLRNELKRVVWPDKKTMKQTTIAVLIVIALSAVTIFVVDSILDAGLKAVGFDRPAYEQVEAE